MMKQFFKLFSAILIIALFYTVLGLTSSFSQSVTLKERSNERVYLFNSKPEFKHTSSCRFHTIKDVSGSCSTCGRSQ